MKVPPHNLDYEESVLASCLLHEDDREAALDILLPTDFYFTGHQRVYDAIQKLSAQNSPVDLVTVTTALRESDQLGAIGGAAYLAKLLDCPICANIEHYAKKLKGLAALRQMICACSDSIKTCFEGHVNPDQAIDQIQASVCAVDLGAKDSGFSGMPELSIERIDRYERLSKNPGTLTGVPSGFLDLDELTCGFQPADLVIIAARPSMGKSALAGNISLNAAKAGHGNAIFSLEMSKAQFDDRMIAAESGVNSIKLRSGMFAKSDWLLINQASEKMYNLPIWIDDTPGLTVMEIRRRARKLKKRENLEMVIIDYLQLITGNGNPNRNNEVSEMTRGLKGLAKELDVPVLLLSQLNRECEKRADKRPMLSDLRDSGAIEQDADVVLFPYRHEHYVKPKFDADGNPTPEFEKWRGVAEINIAKQRMGPTRNITLTWIDKVTKFENACPEGEE